MFQLPTTRYNSFLDTFRRKSGKKVQNAQTDILITGLMYGLREPGVKSEAYMTTPIGTLLSRSDTICGGRMRIDGTRLTVASDRYLLSERANGRRNFTAIPAHQSCADLRSACLLSCQSRGDGQGTRSRNRRFSAAFRGCRVSALVSVRMCGYRVLGFPRYPLVGATSFSVLDLTNEASKSSD